MSIPLLFEVYYEVRRLAIAGSAVAPGDFRLKKLIPPLQKSAEKAPVFGRIGLAVQAVVDSNDGTASTALLELTMLVNARVVNPLSGQAVTAPLDPVEPGVYGDDLRGGVRLEQNYLVTADGIARLSSFPLDL